MSFHPSTMNELKEWVQGAPSNTQNLPANIVLVHCTHSNLNMQFPEIRLDKYMTIINVRQKLHTHTGTSPDSMKLELLDEKGEHKAFLEGDDKMLGYFGIESGDVIHIVDQDPCSASRQGWLEDTSLVEKYEMSNEVYSQRKGTVKEWKEQQLKAQKLQQAANGVPTSAPPCTTTTDDDFQAEGAAAVAVGNRCEVFPGGRRATVKFVGKASCLGVGWWIGVHYDDPIGKHDGTVKGTKFFECPSGFGGMVRPDKVTVGDFPSLEDELAGEL